MCSFEEAIGGGDGDRRMTPFLLPRRTNFIGSALEDSDGGLEDFFAFWKVTLLVSRPASFITETWPPPVETP